jgi:hypothetical protein
MMEPAKRAIVSWNPDMGGEYAVYVMANTAKCSLKTGVSGISRP